ncbi:hypothetical protein HPG69_009824 [Diceros bicornis minor]|uniref:Uncharacterized protein n=1 Tax=Diceros bicornis minor TaxID=77932 RepID=A0A7J7EVI2_DICBM|nr:hypothetical protein HPG69_009824 [Diceros bicornis minor]
MEPGRGPGLTSGAPQPILFSGQPGRRGSRAQSGPITGRAAPANQWGRSGRGGRRRGLAFPAKVGGEVWGAGLSRAAECGKGEVRPGAWGPRSRPRGGRQALHVGAR